jgi:hypothetical protein
MAATLMCQLPTVHRIREMRWIDEALQPPAIEDVEDGKTALLPFPRDIWSVQGSAWDDHDGDRAEQRMIGWQRPRLHDGEPTPAIRRSTSSRVMLREPPRHAAGHVSISHLD